MAAANARAEAELCGTLYRPSRLAYQSPFKAKDVAYHPLERILEVSRFSLCIRRIFMGTDTLNSMPVWVGSRMISRLFCSQDAKL